MFDKICEILSNDFVACGFGILLFFLFGFQLLTLISKLFVLFKCEKNDDCNNSVEDDNFEVTDHLDDKYFLNGEEV